MKRKLLSLILTLTLSLTFVLPASAATAVDVESAFPQVNTYSGFTDVLSTSWYIDVVTTCYETGLMVGTDATTFSPNSFLTVAQIATMGSRLHSMAYGGDGVISTDGANWYDGAITYITNLAKADSTDLGANVLALLENPTANVSRLDFLRILALVTPNSYLTSINDITVLPDTTDATVLTFYNAGILNGMDDYGTFSGSLNLTRAEAAAMMARIVDVSLRAEFTPLPYDLFWVAGVAPTDRFASIGVTAETYLLTVMELIFELETACQEQDVEFNWYNTYGDETFLDYVTNTAMAIHSMNAYNTTTAFKNFDVQAFYSGVVNQITTAAESITPYQS